VKSFYTLYFDASIGQNWDFRTKPLETPIQLRHECPAGIAAAGYGKNERPFFEIKRLLNSRSPRISP
jgi:hypothetical protein